MSTRLFTSSSVHLRWQGRIQVDNSSPPIEIKMWQSWRKILGSSHDFFNPGSQGRVFSSFFSCHQNKKQEKGFELASQLHVELPLLNMSHQDLRTGIFLGWLIYENFIVYLITRLMPALLFEKCCLNGGRETTLCTMAELEGKCRQIDVKVGLCIQLSQQVSIWTCRSWDVN